MKIDISSDAEGDILTGYCFYEEQNDGLGDYFRECIIADIESLKFFAGIHEQFCGYHRMVAKRFPFGIFYELDEQAVTIVAVLDCRRDPSWIRKRLS